ncbi:threonine--tRNA ligase [Candidatus Uhrbacteria bacterium]|nr:threonine--tRNA ligase [Candidatus Uhrbacteria bacterium]
MSAQKNPLEIRRHSAAHLLAAAVLELYPGTKLGVGPVIEHGFFYDFQFPEPVGSEELPKIEKRMREIQKRNEPFVREEMSLERGIIFFQGLDQPFKVELLNDLKTKGTTAVKVEEQQEVDLAKPNVVSIYRTGKFVDLCRGPHLASTREVGAFKLTKVAGAYWRGSEKNPQLTRLYGVAFPTQAELDEFLRMQALAAERDHKKLGLELDLFTFSELVGPGLPLWTPKGALMRALLDDFVWQLRQRRGYKRVEIPHITKRDLYERSGHWEKYKDDLFKIISREGHEFALKPMNCPHHTQIYQRRPWSYRDLPQRYANTSLVYRDEQSGELAGLTRVLSITQDDAHVFCRMSQVEEEALKIWDIIEEFYGAFGIPLRVRLSLRDPAHPEKYLGDAKRWTVAEEILRKLVVRRKVKTEDGMGEAAFYGPKLDFMGQDALGREHQVATIQLDMNMPERFDLVCAAEDGKPERIVMIHAAIMGSIERFLSIAIEHYGGAFPLWLAPVQVAVIPVSEKHKKGAAKLAELLAAEWLRVEGDESNETVGYKIRKAEKQKFPYMRVVGERELKGFSAKTFTRKKFAVRRRGSKETTVMTGKQLLTRLMKEIQEKR